jgi:hypothetical protein
MNTQTYCVTVVADVTFVTPPGDELVQSQSHLRKIVGLVSEAVDGLTTRSVSGVRVTYCDGGALDQGGAAPAAEG